MPVSVAYLMVVLIWSTTPLGIVWSSESVSPTMAVLMRMVIAVLFGWVMLKLVRIELPWDRMAVRLYSYSGVGIFGGMLCAYLASRYLSSGMMSLLFGLAPILSGLLAQKISAAPGFNRPQQLALVVALIGLGIVCSDSMSLSAGSSTGIMLILCGVFFFSLSGVLVKSVEIDINPMATTVGALMISTPLFGASWWLMDGTMPVDQWQARSLWAIIYLGFFGSLIGFVAYFFVLQKLSASTVALVTLITPVLALLLGALLNNESISNSLMIGAVFVIIGLALYQWAGRNVGKELTRQAA